MNSLDRGRQRIQWRAAVLAVEGGPEWLTSLVQRGVPERHMVGLIPGDRGLWVRIWGQLAAEGLM